jgi:hypothetical protein
MLTAGVILALAGVAWPAELFVDQKHPRSL